METTPSKIENAKPSRCQRIKSIFGTRRMTISGRITAKVSQRNFLRLPAPQPADDFKPGYQDGEKQRGQDTDAQGHRKPLSRPGPEPVEQDPGNQCRDMAVEDSAEGAGEPRLQR